MARRHPLRSLAPVLAGSILLASAVAGLVSAADQPDRGVRVEAVGPDEAPVSTSARASIEGAIGGATDPPDVATQALPAPGEPEPAARPLSPPSSRSSGVEHSLPPSTPTGATTATADDGSVDDGSVDGRAAGDPLSSSSADDSGDDELAGLDGSGGSDSAAQTASADSTPADSAPPTPDSTSTDLPAASPGPGSTDAPGPTTVTRPSTATPTGSSGSPSGPPSSTASSTSRPTTRPASSTVPSASTVPSGTGPTEPSTSTVPSSTGSTTTTEAATSSSIGSGSEADADLDRLRNRDDRFTRYAAVPSASLDLAALTEPAQVRDNGTVGDGQFRAACQYSHFAYDDPIVHPGQPGRSHLHMFFGNTGVHAGTTTASLVDSGGGTCNGFELNRSGYWTPALLDGKGNAVVPEMIILYYKTKQPERVQRMPQGLKMVAGNTSGDSFQASEFLHWSCGDSGFAYNVSNRIPDCGGDTINASIAFPQCWDGRNLDSADHRSHLALVSPHVDCPASHPVRLPQISILLYFPGQPSIDGWHLSSDRRGSFNSGPGSSLHADWWGGWNDEAMDLWVDGCMKAARNCSFGQTGTDRVLAKLNNFQNYTGPHLLALP